MSSTQRTLMETGIDELVQRLSKLSKAGLWRRGLAYLLKIVAGGSGLVIALDVIGPLNKWLGAAILIAVFIDGVFANHERLIGETRASHAAKLRMLKITADHNRVLAPLIDTLRTSAAESSEHQVATAGKNSLEKSTHKLLLKAVTEIEQALADLDLKALKSISVEAERAATAKS